MPTPYFALYPTDFLADVGHLGNSELGIYWRLLLVYYRDGRPLPMETDKLRRIAMTFSPEEYRALDSVVSEFFTPSSEPDGTRVWRHKRADREIARATAYIEAKQAGAAKSRQKLAEKRSQTAPVDDSLTSELMSKLTSRLSSKLTSGGEPEPEPEEEKKKDIRPTSGANWLAILISEGVDPQVAKDWLAVRKAKKAPLTATALEGIRREATLAGISLAKAISVCAEAGWQSFKADWLRRHIGAVHSLVSAHNPTGVAL